MRPDSRRRVVVTGLGVVSPVGSGVTDFWRAVTTGAVGTGEVTRFATDGLPTHRAAEVTATFPDGGLKPEQVRSLPRVVRYAVSAAAQAVDDAGLVEPIPYPADRIGVSLGTVMGTRPHLEELVRRGEPLTEANSWARPDLISTVPAELFGFQGPRALLATGCVAGNDAIRHAAELVASGRVDAMVTGGADELSHSVFLLFTSLRALEPDVIRPFDAHRRGTMPAEGAAALVLESLDSALARGAPVYAEILAATVAEDAHHMTAPHPDGRALDHCLRTAVERAGMTARDVDWVSAHGTGTVASDGVEARTVAAALAGRDTPVPLSSVKGMLGHGQGAASALDAVACVNAIRTGVLLGNPTLREPDPACAGVDLVPDASRRANVDVVLSNAFGFGGHTCVVAFGSPRAGGWA